MARRSCRHLCNRSASGPRGWSRILRRRGVMSRPRPRWRRSSEEGPAEAAGERARSSNRSASGRAAGAGSCGGAAWCRDPDGTGGESKRGSFPAEAGGRKGRGGAQKHLATGARAVRAAGAGSCGGAARHRGPDGAGGESKRGSFPGEAGGGKGRGGGADIFAAGARAVGAAGAGSCGGAA